ncbi:MAG: PH domain-containing protein [Pseudomonadota bacterium]
MNEAAFPLGEARRLHPLSLVLGLMKTGPRMVNFLPALVGIGVSGQWWLIVPALLLFIIVSMLFVWLAWARFTWRVDDDDIAIASGIFSRNDRTIPFDRIQDVSIEQGLIARVLGLATVGFETGSAESDKKDDGKLNGISFADAQALRTHIRRHRTGAPVPIGEAAAAPPVDIMLLVMTPKRLLIAGLFSFSLAVLGVLFGLFQTFDNFLPSYPFDFDFWRDMARGTWVESWVLLHRWIAALGSVVVLVVVGLAAGVIRTMVKEWGFVLERNARGFRRTRGLTTRTDVTIPIARVQAAILSTGLARRHFGWYDLRLQSLANDGKGEPDHMVAPLARIGEVDAILRELALDRAGYEGGDDRAHWHRSHPIGIALVPLILLLATGLSFAIISTFAPDYLWAVWLPAFSIPFMALLGWFDWRQRRWHFDGQLLHITKGVLRRRHIILPARNVQSADVSVGPIQRRLGLASLIFGVPGGKEGQHEVEDIPLGEAAALRKELLAAR